MQELPFPRALLDHLQHAEHLKTHLIEMMKQQLCNVTLLTPNSTLYLLNTTSAVVTFPTAITCVQNGWSVGLHTTSYPTAPFTPFHFILLLFVKALVSIVIPGTIWRYDQTPGRGPSYLTYAGDVVVIAELRQVAVLYAVGEEHVLVLMCEVLAGLGEARCGVASGGCCW
jgi:hypothetical protein